MSLDFSILLNQRWNDAQLKPKGRFKTEAFPYETAPEKDLSYRQYEIKHFANRFDGRTLLYMADACYGREWGVRQSAWVNMTVSRLHIPKKEGVKPLGSLFRIAFMSSLVK